MNIFEKLFSFTNIPKEDQTEKEISQDSFTLEHESFKYKELFAKKIENFLTDYRRSFTDNIECADIRVTEMKNFIEKMTIIYEIIYPDIAFFQAKEGEFVDNTIVSQIMFPKNTNQVSSIDETNKELKIRQMIKLLSDEERSLLRKARYNEEINLVSNNIWNPWDRVRLTKRGFVEQAYLNKKSSALKDEKLKGYHIKEVVEKLKAKDITEKAYIELIDEIKRVDKLNKQRDEMLECIMFRIMERGNDFLGARRALIFANDFKTNLDEPLAYEINGTTEEFDIAAFLKQYREFGGNIEHAKTLLFSDKSLYQWCYEDKDDLELAENLKTSEEKALEHHLKERLVSTLYQTIDQEKLKKEKVKQLRIERKLNKNN